MSAFEDYLKKLTPAQQEELQKIRGLVKQKVPGVTETIGYGIPIFKHERRYLIGMGGFKNHMSLFPGSQPIKDLGEKLSAYKTARGTIQFTHDKPLPTELINEIIDSCLRHAPKR